MIQVKSKEEAIEWAKRAPMADNETIEVRQVHEMDGLSRPTCRRRRPASRRCIGKR